MTTTSTPSLEILALLELRLDMASWAVLGISRDASIGEACEAYASLVHALSPLLDDPTTAHRARGTIGRLRLAFRRHVGQAKRRPARGTTR